MSLAVSENIALKPFFFYGFSRAHSLARAWRQQQHMLRACPEKKNDTIFTTYGSGSSWSPSRDRYTNASVPKPSMDMSVRSPPKYRA